MALARKTIMVTEHDAIGQLLDEVGEEGLILERAGTRYRLEREGRSTLLSYDAAAALAGIRAASGSWRDLDTEAIKAEIYRAREEGSHDANRP